MQANCDHCTCSADLTEINAHEGDIVSTNVCIYNKTFCRESGIKVRKELEQIDFGFAPCVPKYDAIFYFSFLKNSDISKESKSKELLNLKEDDFIK